MAYVGIGYSGSDERFLRDLVDRHRDWLEGDRVPRFFGDRFIVLYDSNTAREFAAKCFRAAEPHTLSVYPMGRPFDSG
ncbi:MAG: hypothetical protein GF331_15285 [Chitinivibrionales bacterium]|nr:hypothetical protein [Chitinivibrionales bacterium]